MEGAAGVLYVVATPIGNLGDVTLRALEVLRTADVVAAEDTRQTRKLLARHAVHAQLTSYHDHNKHEKAPVLVHRMHEGQSVALVTDAGTPLISDPGYFLVNEARRAGLAVVAVPGPSAVIAALSIAGLPTDAFTFLGYLAPRTAARQRRLGEFAGLSHTLVLFESPHRLVRCLEDIRAVLGEREVAVCRELTKMHEQVVRGPVSEVIAAFSKATVRGEVTLVVAGTGRRRRGEAEAAD